MVHFIAIISALPLLSLAIPHGFSESPEVLHRDTHMVALDEKNKRMIAYADNGQRLGVYSMNANLPQRRDGHCFPMANADISGIPKINELRNVANQHWGDKKRREVVNDKDFPNRPANICSDDSGAQVVYDEKPACKKTVNEASGHSEGGKIWLQNQQGLSMSSSSTVTRTSSWGIGEKITAGFSFPGIVEIGFETSFTSEFTNSQGETTEISQDSTTLQRFEQPVDEGQTDCKIALTTDTCSIVGKATLKMIATGFLWFQYEDPVANSSGDKNDKHYKWGMVMEKILTKDNDRATTVGFKVNGSVDSQSSFSSLHCTEATDSKGR